MAFIPESYILDSISMAIQDYILPIGGMYRNFTNLNPDILTNTGSGNYRLSKQPIYFNPSSPSADQDYYSSLRTRLSRLDSDKNFNPSNLIFPLEILPPNDSNYNINYINGIINKSGVVSGSLKASYSAKEIKLITSWPERPEDLVLPVMALNSGQYDGTQWALGSEANNVKYLYYIEIWAGNNTQRGWIGSLLEQAFRVDLPLIDFGKGYPVTSSGSINPSFNAASQRIRWLKIEKCRITNLPNLHTTSSLERARASCTLIVSLII